MISTETENIADNQCIAMFIDDILGGCLVECRCGRQIASKENTASSEKAGGVKLICPKCGTELLYPAWAIW